ncbi:MAG: TIGR03560 family F420-dependent LLM class oxidoreductase [Chloroflexota bacterium]|nr:TIGR03560 family F420-dependent LLM class oxidoreductase [Chloroflexota bacterium]
MSIDVSIMIEGQQGLTWPRWQRLARAAEDLGFYGLFRSDHFSNPEGDFVDALETWVSFAWLASNTQRISFGPLVSPASFRNPSILAWQASAIDSLSGGRLRIGLGAGWNEREHDAFGFELGDLDTRFARLEDAIIVVKSLTRSTKPVSYEGEHFSIRDAYLQPRSPRSDGPPLVIGGNGPRRTLPLVAKHADEWNAVSLPLEDFQARSARLDTLLAEQGREPSSLKRTLMTRGLVGQDDAALNAKDSAERIATYRSRGAVIGTPNEIVDQLGRYAEGGIQGVQLQWLDLDDLSGLELIASDVLPQLR